MKRTPLERRTPLKATKPMPNATKPIRQKTPAKPGATTAEREARRIVKARSGGTCEIRKEGVCGGAGTDWSHRIARSQGGPWTPSNGLWACRPCHTYCHANPVEARSWGWQLAPVYEAGDRGNRTMRTAAEFPAWIHVKDSWVPTRAMVYLHDDGTVTEVDFFDLPMPTVHRNPTEGGAAA